MISEKRRNEIRCKLERYADLIQIFPDDTTDAEADELATLVWDVAEYAPELLAEVRRLREELTGTKQAVQAWIEDHIPELGGV